MEKSIQLSYLVVTRNKLPYLRGAMERLITQKKTEDEILVADGGSNDGTQEYLRELKESGKIDFFLSEPDHGIAHAFNKLTIEAKGLLTTFITDDDVYSYPDISACKSFMLNHPDIDIICSEGAILTNFTNLDKDPLEIVRPLNYEVAYRKWTKEHTPFAFCDLGCVFRRSSIPLLGLHNPSFQAPDTEYSFRVTASKAKIAWYTGYTYVNISNPQSTSLVHMKKIKLASDRLNKFYLNKDEDSFLVKKIKILRNKVRSRFRTVGPRNGQTYSSLYPKLLIVAEKWLRTKNANKKPEFLY